MAALPSIRRPPPEAQAAGRAEGDADDLVVLRTVPMPADAGSGLVLGDQGLDDRRRRNAGEGGGAVAQGLQEGGQGRRLVQAGRG